MVLDLRRLRLLLAGKTTQFKHEGLTIPHYTPVRYSAGCAWSLAIWLGIYSPVTRSMALGYRVTDGVLYYDCGISSQ